MYEVEIAKGAEFLDQNADIEGWRGKINLDKLHMGNIYQCVLGQLFGNYWDVIHQYDISSANSQAMGFMADTFSDDYAENGYDTLNREWKEFLAKETAK